MGQISLQINIHIFGSLPRDDALYCDSCGFFEQAFHHQKVIEVTASGGRLLDLAKPDSFHEQGLAIALAGRA